MWFWMIFISFLVSKNRVVISYSMWNLSLVNFIFFSPQLIETSMFEKRITFIKFWNLEFSLSIFFCRHIISVLLIYFLEIYAGSLFGSVDAAKSSLSVKLMQVSYYLFQSFHSCITPPQCDSWVLVVILTSSKKKLVCPCLIIFKSRLQNLLSYLKLYNSCLLVLDLG